MTGDERTAQRLVDDWVAHWRDGVMGGSCERAVGEIAAAVAAERERCLTPIEALAVECGYIPSGKVRAIIAELRGVDAPREGGGSTSSSTATGS